MICFSQILWFEYKTFHRRPLCSTWSPTGDTFQGGVLRDEAGHRGGMVKSSLLPVLSATL